MLLAPLFAITLVPILVLVIVIAVPARAARWVREDPVTRSGRRAVAAWLRSARR